MPANILNLSAYTVTGIEETEHDYHIRAEALKPPSVCPHCRSSKSVGFGRREQMVRDLHMHGRRVGLYIDTKRFQPCQKIQAYTHIRYLEKNVNGRFLPGLPRYLPRIARS